MGHVASIWFGLDAGRKLVVVAATVGVFVAVILLSRLAARPEMALLYSGLDPAQSGEVIRELDSSGVPYSIRGDAILVPIERRDALRMQLASAGVPFIGSSGYELLDNLSGFGTTSQMFDAAYWRAKEGELARTILSSPDVRQVRVHIANPSTSPFRKPTDLTASVMVTGRTGTIQKAAADAYRFLVASAVPGLLPEQVAIIDSLSGTVIGEKLDDSYNMLKVDDQEERLESAVERLLSARLGPGNAVVEISIEPVRESERIRERQLDPRSRVAISTDVEEIASSESNGAEGSVTVASNLPSGDASDSAAASQSQNTETRTITNFEISEVTRDIERTPGAIRRLTVAVLLNSNSLFGGNASVEDIEDQGLANLEKEIDDIRELVLASVGFDNSRGDQISVKAMPFEAPSISGTLAEDAKYLEIFLNDPVRLLQTLSLVAVALALAIFVVRPVLLGAGRERILDNLAGNKASQGLAISLEPDSPLESPLQPGNKQVSEHPEIDQLEPRPELSVALASSQLNSANGSPEGFLDDREIGVISRLKDLVQIREADSLEILQSWLEDAQMRKEL